MLYPLLNFRLYVPDFYLASFIDYYQQCCGAGELRLQSPRAGARKYFWRDPKMYF